MLMPKRVKEGRRKMFRGRMKGQAQRGNTLAFGEFALVAMEPSWITSRQIEAGRIAMTRHAKRGGQVWIRMFPDKSYTKKPLETRMGKGKAPVEGWVAVVKPDRVMFEMAGLDMIASSLPAPSCRSVLAHSEASRDMLRHPRRGRQLD